jgi:hypothetical protein
MLICDKNQGVVLFVAVKNKGGRRRNEGGGGKGCSSNHKLNIIDKFIDDILR